MDDLIKALTILAKYTDSRHPTHCEHDILVIDVNPDDVSSEDIVALDALGFLPGRAHEIGGDCFYSYRFGSC